MEKPEPKRRNPVKTRAKVLDAAFELFSTQGYSQTGIREISQHAGVASSLVMKYFNSKSELFHNALINAILVHGYFPREKKDFGVRMARMMLSRKDAQIPSMMALAIGDPEAKEIARQVTRRIVMQMMEDWLGEPDAQARALNMIILMNGFALQTAHLLEGEVPRATIEWFERSLQAIVDASPAAPGPEAA
jgi:AcrR family transcriptional regulator